MPDLSFLDLYEDHGHLHQLTGSLSVDELIAQQAGARRPADDAAQRTIRAFGLTEHRSRHGEPLAKVVMLQSAALRVLQSLLGGRERGTPEPRLVTVYYTLSPRRDAAPRRLLGRDFTENFKAWLNIANAGETLVEVPAVEPEAIEEMVREMRASLAQLQESVTVAPEQADEAPGRRQAVPADPAAVRRREWAQDWPTAAAVSRQLGSTAENGSHRANQMRRNGQLLGVWLPSEQAYRFPTWQFGADGAAVPGLAELLTLLRGPGGMNTAERRTSGWGEVEWFLTPHTLLDGASPADVLPDDPERVLAVAQEEFQESADARW